VRPNADPVCVAGIITRVVPNVADHRESSCAEHSARPPRVTTCASRSVCRPDSCRRLHKTRAPDCQEGSRLVSARGTRLSHCQEGGHMTVGNGRPLPWKLGLFRN
jgi:hypothetical protein